MISGILTVLGKVKKFMGIRNLSVLVLLTASLLWFTDNSGLLINDSSSIYSHKDLINKLRTRTKNYQDQYSYDRLMKFDDIQIEIELNNMWPDQEPQDRDFQEKGPAVRASELSPREYMVSFRNLKRDGFDEFVKQLKHRLGDDAEDKYGLKYDYRLNDVKCLDNYQDVHTDEQDLTYLDFSGDLTQDDLTLRLMTQCCLKKVLTVKMDQTVSDILYEINDSLSPTSIMAISNMPRVSSTGFPRYDINNYQTTSEEGAEIQKFIDSFDGSRDGVIKRPAKKHCTKVGEPGETCVYVVVVDTGVSCNHNFRKKMDNRFMYPSHEKCVDKTGHGTFVAGIIGDEDYGLLDDVIIVNNRMLGDDDGKETNIDRIEDSLLEVMKMAIDREGPTKDKMMVINMSLEEYDPVKGGLLSQTVKMLASMDRVIIVVAAGNAGENAESWSPANIPGTLAVGSMNKGMEGLERSVFSNHGKNVCGYWYGRDVVSTDHQGGEFKILSGTSMSTPFVSASIAAIINENPYGNGKDLTKKDISDILASTSKKCTIKGNMGPEDSNRVFTMDNNFWDNDSDNDYGDDCEVKPMSYCFDPHYKSEFSIRDIAGFIVDKDKENKDYKSDKYSSGIFGSRYGGFF